MSSRAAQPPLRAVAGGLSGLPQSRYRPYLRSRFAGEQACSSTASFCTRLGGGHHRCSSRFLLLHDLELRLLQGGSGRRAKDSTRAGSPAVFAALPLAGAQLLGKMGGLTVDDDIDPLPPQRFTSRSMSDSAWSRRGQAHLWRPATGRAIKWRAQPPAEAFGSSQPVEAAVEVSR
jgi:hypothetical protein